MEAFEIRYHSYVLKRDIPKLAPTEAKRIRDAIAKKLTSSPQLFGMPLRSELIGFHKLRVGDFRVIFQIQGTIVYIIMIEHRSIVYRDILKRI